MTMQQILFVAFLAVLAVVIRDITALFGGKMQPKNCGHLPDGGECEECWLEDYRTRGG